MGFYWAVTVMVGLMVTLVFRREERRYTHPSWTFPVIIGVCAGLVWPVTLVVAALLTVGSVVLPVVGARIDQVIDWLEAKSRG